MDVCLAVYFSYMAALNTLCIGHMRKGGGAWYYMSPEC